MTPFASRQASENESEVLELCKTPAAQAMRRQLMAEGCHLVNTESGATAQGSPLAYHRQSVLLLADCALGGNPTLVVKASGFYSLQEVPCRAFHKTPSVVHEDA